MDENLRSDLLWHALKGDARAQYKLGLSYYSENMTRDEFNIVAFWIVKSLINGYPEAEKFWNNLKAVKIEDKH